MHDHATDAGLAAFHGTASARALRLHLDNAHDYMTSGWTYDRMVERHEALHADEDVRLARLGDAANLIAERLAEAPATVVESILTDRAMYLTDANGTLYLAEPVDPRHMPAAGDLFRLTVEAPPPADIVGAMEASIAATRAYLDAHKSGGPIPSEASAGASGPATVDALPAPPSSTAAPNLLRDGVEPGAAVGPNVGGGGPSLPCRSDRLAPSGNTDHCPHCYATDAVPLSKGLACTNDWHHAKAGRP